MENITIGSIETTLKFIIEFGGLIVTIYFAVKKAVNKAFEPLNKRMDQIEKNMSEKIDEVEIKSVENFLVQEIASMKQSNIPLDDATAKYFYDQYDIYIKHGNNSYIKHEVELCQQRKLI